MDDLPMTRAEGFPVQGQITTGEVVTGLLTLRYDRQQIDGFPHPVGAGMTRRCELTIEGMMPERPLPFTAMVISDRLGERMQIDVTPHTVSPSATSWTCEGPYELVQRWRLPGAGLGLQDLPDNH